MSAWVNWTWANSTPVRREPQPRPIRPYHRTAQHIRGRVYRMGHKTTAGDWMWGMEVVNTRTGQVVASDNCSHYRSLVALCEEATGAARAAWFWSFKKGELS